MTIEIAELGYHWSMRKTKSPEDSRFTSRKLVMPDQINPHGSLFGGVLMSWIDKVAYMSAQRHSEVSHVVTVNIDQIHFKLPIKIDDHVLLSSSVDYVGQTSMEIGVKVERENACTGQREFAAFALLTFVALDQNSRPTQVPRLNPQTQEEQERFERARIRVKVRGKLRKWLEERFPQRMALDLVRFSAVREQ